METEVLSSIERKVQKANPIRFRNALLKFKRPKTGQLQYLSRVSKKSKGTAMLLICLLPFRMFPRKLKTELVQRNLVIFQRSNEKLKEQLPKAEKEIQRIFVKTALELNDLGIEQSTLLLERWRNMDIGVKMEKDFIEKPNSENLMKFWNFAKRSMELEIKLARLHRRKADVQDRIAEYDRKMTRFDKRDIEDFQRAIMVDAVMSYLERRILFVGTPIEIMLKSGRIMNRIRGFFLITPALRADAELIEEEQNQLISWFRDCAEKL